MTERARIAIDDGVAYVAWTAAGTLPARLPGKMLRDVRAGKSSRPVVGDWIAVAPDGTIESLEPRRTKLARKAAGAGEEEQVLAANVDVAFVATAPGLDLNERRLERYLAIVHDGGAEPVVLLTKSDTCTDVDADRARIQSVASNVDVVVVSAAADRGLHEVARRVAPDRTGIIVGSSGVGKSTLINRLLGESRLTTGRMGRDGKGRHTTTRRELLALPTGGFLIDTPGMRELGVLHAEAGLDDAFPEIAALARECSFPPCGHEREVGCAVRAALATGALDSQRFESWRKLHDETRPARRTRR